MSSVLKSFRLYPVNKKGYLSLDSDYISEGVCHSVIVMDKLRVFVISFRAFNWKNGRKCWIS